MKIALIVLVTVLLAIPARAVEVGVRIPLGANPAPVASAAPSNAAAEPHGACVANTEMIATGAAQVVDSFVVANARSKGSLSATWAMSSKSWPTNLLEHAALDAAAITITRHWSCASRAIIYFSLGASAINDAARTGFPR